MFEYCRLCSIRTFKWLTDIMFSTCPSVTKDVNTIFWKRMDWFWCKLATVVSRGNAMKRSTFEVNSSKVKANRSIKLNPFRGVAAFLVQYCMELDYREYVIFIECYFLTVHWCVYHVETTGRINCVFYIVNRNVRNTEKYCKNYSVLIF